MILRIDRQNILNFFGSHISRCFCCLGVRVRKINNQKKSISTVQMKVEEKKMNLWNKRKITNDGIDQRIANHGYHDSLAEY